MNVLYSRTSLPKSIFLAGPTPRAEHVKSWRPDAIGLLYEYGFDGTVFVPEDSAQSWAFSYDDQVEWELQALHMATVILFWVPRDFTDMPAMTTNVEFGLFAKNRNVVLGAPDNAVRMKYLKALAKLYSLPFCSTLDMACKNAIEKANRPFPTE